jgi:hypothetical protein
MFDVSNLLGCLVMCFEITLQHISRVGVRKLRLIYVLASKNVTIKLDNWHPTSCRDVDSTDNYDIAALDAIWPDPP